MPLLGSRGDLDRVDEAIVEVEARPCRRDVSILLATGLVEDASQLAQAPAQLAARVVGHVPEQARTDGCGRPDAAPAPDRRTARAPCARPAVAERTPLRLIVSGPSMRTECRLLAVLPSPTPNSTYVSTPAPTLGPSRLCSITEIDRLHPAAHAAPAQDDCRLPFAVTPGRHSHASQAATRTTAGRGRLFDSILDTVGDTPAIRINNLGAEAMRRSTSRPSSSIRPPRSRTGWRSTSSRRPSAAAR